MGTWVIPDVHGCLHTLQSLVQEYVRPSADDTLIFLGDMIDRGPDSRGVLDYIMHLQKEVCHVTALMGNHEDSMLRVVKEAGQRTSIQRLLGRKDPFLREWLAYGGSTTFKSFGTNNPLLIPDKYLEWIGELPYYLELENFLLVHAGFNFEKTDLFADRRAMLWARDYTIKPEKLKGKRILHGHVPLQLDFIVQSLPSGTFDFIGLDNGVYMHDRDGYGQLLALEVNTLELLIQPNIDF